MVLAGAIGMVAALIAASSRTPHPAWAQFRQAVSAQKVGPASEKDLGDLDRMKPQKQAETLLELAVGHSERAVDQISSRVDGWNGRVEWNSQIATLTTAALNSSDMRVRESGVEVELAAYGLSKNTASLEYLLRTADSPDHRQKVWALWALGLMANRGVEPGRIVEVLSSHLHDADVDSRRWAVEGLALSGVDDAIQPLLATMHDDQSPLVRERAACSLAESGLFTSAQRWTAVPQLLNYTEDPALDAQTHRWAFQALGDISHQRLGNDAGAWRRWYEKTVGSGQ
jgi:HEAT repeat protein